MMVIELVQPASFPNIVQILEIDSNDYTRMEIYQGGHNYYYAVLRDPNGSNIQIQIFQIGSQRALELFEILDIDLPAGNLFMFYNPIAGHRRNLTMKLFGYN